MYRIDLDPIFRERYQASDPFFYGAIQRVLLTLSDPRLEHQGFAILPSKTAVGSIVVTPDGYNAFLLIDITEEPHVDDGVPYDGILSLKMVNYAPDSRPPTDGPL